MGIIGGILATVGYIAFLAFWIITLIKMFKTETSPLQGIIGIFCWIWAYIWGWMNASKLALKKTMILWTLSLVLGIIGSIIVGASGANAFQAELEKAQKAQLEQQRKMQDMQTPMIEEAEAVAQPE